MMSDSKNSLTKKQQKQINKWVEALPTALHGLEEYIKVALVLKGFRSIDKFPSAVDRDDWEDLRVACGLEVADRIAVKKALYLPQPQDDQTQVEPPLVNLYSVTKLASYASCRCILESFRKDFVKMHKNKAIQSKCKVSLTEQWTMTDIFRHFEICEGVTKSDKLLGDNLSNELDSKGIALPSEGNFAKVYQDLSQNIYTFGILKSNSGHVVVPHDLDPNIKRFWIRFLMARGHEVRIYGTSGLLTEPKSNDIVTLEKQMTPVTSESSDSLGKKSQKKSTVAKRKLSSTFPEEESSKNTRIKINAPMLSADNEPQMIGNKSKKKKKEKDRNDK